VEELTVLPNGITAWVKETGKKKIIPGVGLVA